MKEYKITAGTPIYAMVCALCKDYDRRREAIQAKDGDASTLFMYQYYNDAIDLGIAEVCEEGIREVMRDDIGGRVGCLRTILTDYMSYGTFKMRKSHSIEAIARHLHLIYKKPRLQCASDALRDALIELIVRLFD